MTKTDWAMIAFNTLALMMAVVGLATQHPEPMSIALILALASILLTSARILRRRSPYERAPESSRQLELEDDMDIHRVLDIDQRLEALERAEARRIRELSEEGLLSVPELSLDDRAQSQSARQRV
ncbi:MAG: hypothetical protein Rubg2KO_24810 [Rubricoccaceae bacterium]